MFLYAVRYQSWFLPKIRCKCLRFFVAKIQKHMGKPILLVAFDMLGRFFSVILIFLKTIFLGKTEDAIIFQHIPARDIVSHSNCRFGKRRQKNLPDWPSLSQAFKLLTFFACHNQSSRSCFKFMTAESTNGTASKRPWMYPFSASILSLISL